LTGRPGAKSILHESLFEIAIMPTPHEFAIAGVYMPPMLVAALFGIIATVLSVRLISHYRWSKYFAFPPAVFLALTVIYTVFFGTFIIGA
jgi:hypothetical protein